MKIVIGIVVVLALFLGYVSTREGKFNYARSGVINAPPEKIFPYLTSLKMGEQWSPYQKMDPEMKVTYTGTDGQEGSAMDFESSKAGSGKVEILKITPNQSVDVKLTMIKPVHGENAIVYSLAPEATGGTRFTWAMSGDGGFMTKLMSVFIDCEKMVTADFEKGIANLKTVVEAQK